MGTTYLNRTPSSAGNRRTWTWSSWVKLHSVGSNNTTDNNILLNARQDDGNLEILQFNGSTGTFMYANFTGAVAISAFNTNAVYRDFSGWYHVVLEVDTTQATDSNRIKLYINGVQETSLVATYGGYPIYPPQNTQGWINNTVNHEIGAYNTTARLNATLAHTHLTDGTAYDASAFGETDATTGIWKPKTAPSVTYGTNGFFLKFENSGSMGTDSSGNANNFTVNGTMTQTVDTPSNVFATLNPLASQAGSSASSTTNTFSNGNLTVTDTISETAIGNLGVSQGKWFWEVKVVTDQDGLAIGGANQYYNLDAELGYNSPSSPTDAKVFGYYGGNGNKFITVGDGSQFTSYGSAIAVNDIVGVAMNLDDNEVTFYLNGSSQGTFSITALGSGEVYFPAVGNWSGGTITVSFNFGNGYFGTTAVSSAENPDDGIGIFEYAVPTGYKALCTKSINSQEYS